MVFRRCNEALVAASARIHKGIADFFQWEGKLVARYPIVTIVLTILLAAGLGCYGFLFKFREEARPSALFAAEDAPSVVDKEFIEGQYGYLPMEEKLLVVSKAGDEVNLLADPHKSLGELLSIWEVVQDVSIGGHSNFDSLCERPKQGYPCKVYSILTLWDFNRTRLLNDPNPLVTINKKPLVDPYGKDYNLTYVLGGIQYDEDGRVVAANVFQNVFGFDMMLTDSEKTLFDALMKQGVFDSMKDDLDNIAYHLSRNMDPRPLALDRVLAEKMSNWGHRNDTDLETRMTHIFRVQDESVSGVTQDLKWLSLSVVLVGLFSHFVLFRNSWVFCKVHIVPLCFLSIGMAIAAAFGLALTLGVPFNVIITTVPFLMIGLGVDDTFIIMGQFRRTDRNLPPEERIAIAMSHAGASIFVTSMTDLGAFLLAISSAIPCLQQFGVYASLGVAFDFFFQVTTFLAFAALEARREHRHHVAASGMHTGIGGKNPSSETLSSVQSGTIKCLITVVHVDDMERSPSHEDSQSNGLESRKGSTVSPAECNFNFANTLRPQYWKLIGRGNFDPDVPVLSTKVFGHWIPSVTCTKWGCTMVALLEVLVLGAAMYGCVHVTEDLRYREWFTRGSEIQYGFELEAKHLHGEQVQMHIFTKDGSYFYNQEELLNCVEAVKTSGLIADVPEFHSWFEDYYIWSQKVHGNETTEKGFAKSSGVFLQWVVEFLHSDDGALYAMDVQFSEDRSKIVRTKLAQAYTRDIVSGQYAVNVMTGLRKIAHEEVPDLSPIVFNPMFPFYDGLRIIHYETVRNVATVGAVVFFLIMLTLANFWGACIVALMIALTDTMIFGYMWYAGLTFNMVTSITIVLAVGITVDYSVHIAHSFLTHSGTRKERAALALQNIGGEVFCAAFTSLLAVLGLAFTEHYVMQVFFQMFSAIIVFGAWHGIIILPMVLAFVGPPPYADAHALGK